MAVIIPAVIGRAWSEVKQKIKQLEGLVPWIQVDVVDGQFAAPATWQTAGDLTELHSQTKIEVHLMIEHPEATLADWLGVADRVLIHYEATDHLPEIINAFAGLPVIAGVALKLATPIERVLPFLDKITVVQLMSIKEIGAYGQPFADQVLEKISTLRKTNSDVIISVDGGIDLINGKKCLAAGANNLVVGSALWQSPNITETIHEFQKLTS